MQAQKKGFVIQSFRQQANMDQAAASKLFGSLSKAIDEVYQQNASSLSFEELYRNAYNLVLYKHGEFLYDGVSGAIKGHLIRSAETISTTKNDEILKVLGMEWESHKTAFHMIKDILMYMDKTYVQPRTKTPIYVRFLQLFREVVTAHADIRVRLRCTVLENITLERQGCLIDRDLIKRILSMFEDLGIDGFNVYEQDIESYFIEETKAFYQKESLEFLSQNSCSEYMRKIEERLSEEASRVVHYLSVSSDTKLRSAVEHELITVHAKALIDMETSGLCCMLRDKKLNDLKRMYALLTRVPSCLDLLRDAVGRYIGKCGLEIVENQETTKDPVMFLKLILELKDKFDQVIKEAFRAEKKMQKKLQEAFETFLNKDNRSAHHLATYIDDLLRSGMSNISEADVDSKLEKVIVIFKYLTDKDIFESYYKNLLSKRLLTGKTMSDEIEKTMIAKLKAECGYQFTSKLEGMFVDMNMSKDIMEQYKKTTLYSRSAIEVDIHMLTTGYWPLRETPPCILPRSMLSITDTFTRFYLDMNNGRKLTWMHNLGSVDLKATFSKTGKDYLMVVSIYQMVILNLFNESTTLSLDAIRRASGITQELDLRRHLLSLCTPKLKVLRKLSKGKGVEDVDEFTFNDDFTSKFKRIKVPLISAKEVQLGSSSGSKSSSSVGKAGDDSMVVDEGGVPAAVEEERRHMTEATLVRIMKSRKTFNHNELVAEVTRQLSYRFMPTPPAIKKRIESLIERDYLKRDDEDARLYHYVA